MKIEELAKLLESARDYVATLYRSDALTKNEMYLIARTLEELVDFVEDLDVG